MTRHLIRHLLFLIFAGSVLAACTASTAPPSKRVARPVATQPSQTLHVQIPPGTKYVAPPARPNTTYVMEIQHDASALQSSHAALVKAQQERAQREAELAAQREQARRERDAALARLGQIEQVKTDPRGLVISLGGTLMFRHDDATLLPAARARLDRIADALKQMAPDQKIMIEGHTDAVGTDEYNARLSENRANAVRSYLLQCGVAPDQVAAVGRGESEPIAPNQTAEGRANNRRVEIVIGPSKAADAG